MRSSEEALFYGFPIFVMLLIVLAAGAWWYFTFIGLYRWLVQDKPLTWRSTAFLQIQCVMISAIAAFRFGDLFWWVAPPMPLTYYLLSLWDYSSTFLRPMGYAFVMAGIVFAIVHLIAPYALRLLNTVLTGLAACLFFYFFAAVQTEHSQKISLKRLQPDCIQFVSLRKSIRIANRARQLDHHTLALRNGSLYGWSFAKTRFYPIEPDIAVNLNGSDEFYRHCYNKEPQWANMEADKEKMPINSRSDDPIIISLADE